MIAPDDITLKLAEKKEGASPDSQSELLKDLFKGVKGDTTQLINAFLFGQNADVTKALDILSETLNGKEYVKLLNILESKQMKHFRKQKLFQSLNDFLSRGDKLLKRLTEEQYDLEFTQILSQQVLEKLHEIQNALALHEKHQAQEQLLAKPIEELKKIAEETYSKGEVLLNQDSNYLEALKQFTLCLKLKEKVFGQGGVLTIATIMSLGDVHYRLQNYQRAISLYKRALKIYEEKGFHDSDYAGALYRLGHVYASNTTDYASAIKYFEEAVQEYEQQGNEEWLNEANTMLEKSKELQKSAEKKVLNQGGQGKDDEDTEEKSLLAAP